MISEYVSAQNLVLNPSFEDFSKCPEKLNVEGHVLKNLKNWNQPTYGTCDYFNFKCDFSLKIVSDIGYLPPRTGNGMAGLVCNSVHPDYREYIEGKLIKPLIKDSLYCVDMFVSLASKSRYSVDCIGMYISDVELSDIKSLTNSYKPIKVKPQIRTPRGATIKSDKWVQVSGIYKAKGEEQYITIGDFCSDNEQILDRVIIKNTTSSKYYSIKKIAYYFIDDVSVIPIHDSANCKCMQQKTIIKDNVLNVELNKINNIVPDKQTVLQNIYFDTDKYELLPQSYKELDSVLVNQLNENKNIKVEILGYTDNDANEEYNLKLSENRAKAVVEYLISKGIDKSRLTYKGYGAINPVAPNDTETNKAKNRRVEFKIIKE